MGLEPDIRHHIGCGSPIELAQKEHALFQQLEGKKGQSLRNFQGAHAESSDARQNRAPKMVIVFGILILT